jgi:hypothetical protein
VEISDDFSVLTLTPGTGLYSESYNYNPAGNIDQKVVSGTTATAATWTYDYAPTSVRPHAVKKITSGSTNQTYGYDAAGNMTSRSAGIQGALALTYTRLHLPSRVGSSPTSSDGLTIQYDADGERVRKLRGRHVRCASPSDFADRIKRPAAASCRPRHASARTRRAAAARWLHARPH